MEWLSRFDTGAILGAVIVSIFRTDWWIILITWPLLFILLNNIFKIIENRKNKH